MNAHCDWVTNYSHLFVTGESMEIDISPSTPEKEWSPPQLEEGESNTLQLLKPIEDTLRSQSKIIGEFSVTLTKVTIIYNYRIFFSSLYKN